MLNYLWSFLMILSIICCFFTGKIENVASAILSGAESSVSFLISIAGIMAFWTGIIEIVKKSGADKFISKLLNPIINVLFPEIQKNKELVNSICVTVVANFLGISNAVTPLAIDAVSKIESSNVNSAQKHEAINTFIILSIAGVQLMPSMLISLRKQYGSASPFKVLPLVWAVSFISLIFGIIILKFEIFLKSSNFKAIKQKHKNILMKN